MICGTEEDLEIRQENGIRNVLDMCDRKLDEYISRRAEIWKNMDILIEEIRRYNIAYDNYLHRENIFNKEELIPAVPSKTRNIGKKVSAKSKEMKGAIEDGDELTAEVDTTIKISKGSAAEEQDGAVQLELSESEQGQTEIAESAETKESSTEMLDQLPKNPEKLEEPIQEFAVSTDLNAEGQFVEMPYEPEDELDAWINKIITSEKRLVAAGSVEGEKATPDEIEGVTLEVLEERRMRRALLDSIKGSQQELNELRTRLAQFGVEGEKINE